MNFWENVDYIREFRAITRKELAYKAGFSVNSISTGIARGSFPAVDVACRIAAVLGVSVEFLANADAMKDDFSAAAKKNDGEAVKELEMRLENMVKYSDMVEDFSALSPEMQKPLEELIHKIALG